MLRMALGHILAHFFERRVLTGLCIAFVFFNDIFLVSEQFGKTGQLYGSDFFPGVKRRRAKEIL